MPADVNTLSLRVTPCANKDVYEYRLLVGDRQIGRSVFLMKGMEAAALRKILGVVA